MRKLNYFIWIFSLIALISCSDDDDDKPEVKLKGVFVVNEGNSNGGSISFFSPENKTIQNGYFEKVNQRSPGVYIQSFYAMENRGFLMSHGSHKIEAVNMDNFKSTGVIKASYPRYMINAGSNKAYVSDGSHAGKILIVDVAAAKITDSIKVGNGPEELAKVGDKVFVANSGGWTIDSTLSVIDTKTNKLIKTIYVKHHNPTALVVDAATNLWVLCKGISSWYKKREESPSYLVKINTSSYTIEKEIKISDTQHPYRLAISNDKQTLYYINNGVFKTSVTATTLPSTALIEGNFYGIKVNPQNDNLYIFTSEFSKAAKLIRYKPDGTKIDEYTVGIGANGAFFNY